MVTQVKQHNELSRHQKRGSALVAVFWVMAVLALAVFAAVRVVYYDSDIASSQLHGFEALQVAERGIAVAVNPAVEELDPILNWQDEELDISYGVTRCSVVG